MLMPFLDACVLHLDVLVSYNYGQGFRPFTVPQDLCYARFSTQKPCSWRRLCPLVLHRCVHRHFPMPTVQCCIRHRNAIYGSLH